MLFIYLYDAFEKNGFLYLLDMSTYSQAYWKQCPETEQNGNPDVILNFGAFLATEFTGSGEAFAPVRWKYLCNINIPNEILFCYITGFAKGSGVSLMARLISISPCNTIFRQVRTLSYFCAVFWQSPVTFLHCQVLSSFAVRPLRAFAAAFLIIKWKREWRANLAFC